MSIEILSVTAERDHIYSWVVYKFEEYLSMAIVVRLSSTNFSSSKFHWQKNCFAAIGELDTHEDDGV